MDLAKHLLEVQLCIALLALPIIEISDGLFLWYNINKLGNLAVSTSKWNSVCCCVVSRAVPAVRVKPFIQAVNSTLSNDGVVQRRACNCSARPDTLCCIRSFGFVQPF